MSLASSSICARRRDWARLSTVADIKNYISTPGAVKLRTELDLLFRVERPKVVRNVAAAAAEGDRSENAEYIYGKKRLREIDRRLEWLSKTLAAIVIIEPPRSCAVIAFLHFVELEDDHGKVLTVRIVGQDETDAKAGCISWRSPVGRALLQKRVDDRVTVQTPGGQVSFTILDVRLTA